MKILSKKNKRQKMSPELKLARSLLLIILFIVLVAIFSGCKSRQPVVTNDFSSVSSYIEKDKLIPVPIPGESSVLRVQFECDSLSNILLKDISEFKSKNIATSFSFKKNQLDYIAHTQPDTVLIPSTDRYYYINRRISTTLTITKKVTVDKPVRGFFWWTGLLSWIGLAAYAAFKLVQKTSIVTVIKKLLNND